MWSMSPAASPVSNPTRQHSPNPMRAISLPSTSTHACFTLWTTARTSRSSNSSWRSARSDAAPAPLEITRPILPDDGQVHDHALPVDAHLHFSAVQGLDGLFELGEAGGLHAVDGEDHVPFPQAGAGGRRVPLH